MLISAPELHARLGDPTLVVFDCRHDLADHARGARVYAEGHIPGAHFAAVETDLSGRKTGTNGRHPLPAPTDLAAFLARHGVTPSTTLVACCDSGSSYAVRLWWLARWIGHKRVAVLDGGLPAWLARNFPLTCDVPAPAPAAPYPARPGAMPVTTAGEIAASLAGGGRLLLDARAPERYRGEQEPIDPVAGRIPGALNRFHKTNLTSDQIFRPPEELRREFLALLGDRRPTELAHYCGSGITGTVNLFAMELAGLPGSPLYAGSWSEWIADPARAVARGPA